MVPCLLHNLVTGEDVRYISWPNKGCEARIWHICHSYNIRCMLHRLILAAKANRISHINISWVDDAGLCSFPEVEPGECKARVVIYKAAAAYTACAAGSCAVPLVRF